MKRPVRIFLIILAAVIAAALIAGAAFIAFNQIEKERAARYADNIYENAFREVVLYMEKANSTLHKLAFSGDIETAASLWQTLGAAKASLDLLPPTEADLTPFYSFLAQAGDYAYSSALAELYGGQGADPELIAQLTEFSDELITRIKKIAEEFDGAALTVGNYQSEADEDNIQARLAGMFDDEFSYDGIIYDGANSSHLSELGFALTEGRQEQTIEQAREKAAQITGVRETEAEESADAREPARYRVTAGDDVLYFTKAGLYLISLTSPGAKFDASLENLGYPDMVPYVSNSTDYAVYTDYVYLRDGIYYLDRRISVTTDASGAVTSVDATEFIRNHTDAPIGFKPKLSAGEAKSALAYDGDPARTRLCMIQSAGKSELLCYEFLFHRNGEQALCYVSAENGRVIKTEFSDNLLL